MAVPSDLLAEVTHGTGLLTGLDPCGMCGGPKVSPLPHRSGPPRPACANHLARPLRRECIGHCSPGKYAAYLNLIEPWWKILRSLALAGRRFESWEEIADAIHCSTVYWNAHRHPFVWGKRRRHRPRRSPGIALLPRAA